MSEQASVSTSVTIDGRTVSRGTRQRLELPVASLPTQTPLSLPVEVVCGRRPGPRLWLSAALHGDELNGVEIIHRVLEKLSPRSLRGQVIAVPIVNVFGFITHDRYLPDRRDLNRAFPGSETGSLAARLARLFLAEVVHRCTHGIDLHTASGHRVNLPQVRGDLEDEETLRIAGFFAAPIMIHGAAPGGSLRESVAAMGVPVLTYEAGEPHRFNPEAIDIGVKGVLRVMAGLGMRGKDSGRARQSMQTRRRTWVRASRSGILRLKIRLGQWVSEGQPLGRIHDAFGGDAETLMSPCEGLVIGQTNHPLVSEGDAVLHLAREVVTHSQVGG